MCTKDKVGFIFQILKDRDDLALENQSLKQELPGQDACLVGKETGLVQVMNALSGQQGNPMIKFNMVTPYS